MGALLRFEAFVENLLEGSLTRLLRGQLQPVEIAKRLARAMETSKTVSVGRVFVANQYSVYLNLRDFQRLESVRATMERELAEYLAGVAREQNFFLISKPLIKLELGDGLPPRQIRVEARLTEQPAPTGPAATDLSLLDLGQTRRFESEQLKRAPRVVTEKAALVVSSGPTIGTRYFIGKPTMTIGRDLGNDIVIDDSRVSRHHAEIRHTAGKVSIGDLNSTNGTWVNGQRTTERILANGDRISIGGVELFFETES